MARRTLSGAPSSRSESRTSNRALAQPDRVIHIGKRKEFDLKFGDRGGRTQLAVSFLEDFKQPFTHGNPRLARRPTSTLALRSPTLGPQTKND